MRTLHFGLRVADLDRSLAFYTAVGYEVVGEVPETSLGHLTMLRLPDDEFVTIELVHNPNDTTVGGGDRPEPFRHPRRLHGRHSHRARRPRHRSRSAYLARCVSRLSNDLDRRPRRQPDRVRPV